MKKIIKRMIIGSPLEQPIRKIFRKDVLSSASINPIIPFLKDRFSDRNSISVLEIGALYGDSSEKLISELKVENYVIVDPYETYEEYEDDRLDSAMKSKGGDAIFNNTKARLSPLLSKLVFHRCFSNNPQLLAQLSSQRFDIIFIDGNHEYKYVLDDLLNYYPLVAKGGVICGDDFHSRSKKHDTLGKLPEDSIRPMVFEAVEEFSKKIGKNYLTFGNHRGYPKTFAFVVN